MKPDGINYP